MAYGIMDLVGDVVDTPASVVRSVGVLDPLRGIKGIIDPSKRVTGREFTDAFTRGVGTITGMETGYNPGTDTIVNLLADPVTGAGMLGRMAVNAPKTLAKGGALAKRGFDAMRGTRAGQAVGGMASQMAPRIGRGVERMAESVGQGAMNLWGKTPVAARYTAALAGAGIPTSAAANRLFTDGEVVENFPPSPKMGSTPPSPITRDGVRFVYDQSGSMQPELPPSPQREIPDLPPEFAARVAARAAERSSPSLSAAMVTPESMEATRQNVMGQRDAYMADQNRKIAHYRNEAEMNPFPYGSPGRLAQFAAMAPVRARGEQALEQMQLEQQFERPFRQEQAALLRDSLGQERDLSMAELFQRENESLRSHGAGSERMAQERAMAEDRNMLSLLDLMMSNNINPYQAEQIALERRGMDLKEQLQQAQLRNAGMLPQPEGTEATPEQATSGGSNLGWGVPAVVGGSYLANAFPPAQQITRLDKLRQLAGGPARMMGRVPGPWWAKAGAVAAAPFIWDYMTTPTAE